MAKQALSDKPILQKQSTRRLVYGLNVAIAIVAAIGVVMFLNWIAYRQYHRFDLTATRQYSLSQQTHRVLDRLEQPYRIVTLFSAVGPRREHVRDLIDEYGRYARNVTVEHIDPNRDVALRDGFLRELRSRYDAEIQPLAEALQAGQETLASTAESLARIGEELGAGAADRPTISAEPVRRLVEELPAQLSTISRRLESQISGLEEAGQAPMPDYPGIYSVVEANLRQLNENELAPLVERVGRAADMPGVPPAVADALLGMRDRLRQVREQVRQALTTLGQTPRSEAYFQLVADLSVGEAVVVVGPEQVRVIDLQEMYQEIDPQVARQTGARDLGFIGEERLTGALVSLSVEKPALVVFVTSPAIQATGQRGQFNHVADRLRAANFDVQQWNPAGGQTAMGQQVPPEPPPHAAEGQRTIWIVLPAIAANPLQAGAGRAQTVATLEAMGPEDAALIMLAPDPGVRYGVDDDVVEFVRGWGITPQLDRLVLRQVELPNHQTRAGAQIPVTQWPRDLPITRALGAMQGLVTQASPLVVGNEAGVEHHPLVQLRGDGLWAERNFEALSTLSDARFDEETAAEVFTVGVAAEREGQRLVVVADAAWASDPVANYGQLGPGTAAIAGAAFPANGELFVNSVYWLAGLDELIAASPRTQDVRRIENLSATAHNAYRLVVLAGLPLAIAVVGLSVYFVRRRG